MTYLSLVTIVYIKYEEKYTKDENKMKGILMYVVIEPCALLVF